MKRAILYTTVAFAVNSAVAQSPVSILVHSRLRDAYKYRQDVHREFFVVVCAPPLLTCPDQAEEGIGVSRHRSAFTMTCSPSVRRL